MSENESDPARARDELSDLVALTLTIYGEARGEPSEGRLAVANVITNRLHTGRWGQTYAAVCLAPKQFSCWNVGDPNRALLLELVAHLAAGGPIADPVLRECRWIAQGTINGDLTSRIGHEATHYYAASMRTPPWWATGAVPCARVGNHLFFEHVA